MMEMTVGDKIVRLNRIDTFTQLLLAKKVAPIVGAAISMGAIAGKHGEKDDESMLGMSLMSFMMNQISGMDDNALIDIFKVALASVSVKVGDSHWQTLYVPDGGFMYRFELVDLVRILKAVIAFNLGDFFSALPTLL